MSEPEEKCSVCGKPTNMAELELWDGKCSDCVLEKNTVGRCKTLLEKDKEVVEFT